MFYDRLRATSILSVVQAFGVIASVLRTKATALLIGAAGVGLINYFNQGIALMGHMGGFGLSFSGIQRLSRLYERGNHSVLLHHIALLRTYTFLAALLAMVVGGVAGAVMGRIATGTWEQATDWCWVSPAIAFTILIGTEGAILKATRQLRRLAYSTAASTLFTLLIAVAVYATVGLSGVVFVLVGCLAVQWALMYAANHGRYPLRWLFRDPAFLRVGGLLLRLGVPYLGAALVGSGGDFLISVCLFRLASVETVGLYAAGFALTVSYVRLLFAAVEADYFPRLSALVHREKEAVALANEQIAILVLLVAPVLLLLGTVLPWIVPLLYSADFLAVVPMITVALLSMFFKAMYTPVAYFSLAHAKSGLYFVMETAYYLVLLLLVVGGYYIGSRWGANGGEDGLLGAGIGITLANVFDCCVIYWVYTARFRFVLLPATLRLCCVQGALVVAGLAVCFFASSWEERAVVGLPFLLSVLFSWRQIKKEIRSGRQR